MKNKGLICIAILLIVFGFSFIAFVDRRDSVELQAMSEMNFETHPEIGSEWIVKSKETKGGDRIFSKDEVNEEVKESALASLGSDLNLNFRFRSRAEFIEVESSDKVLIANMTDEQWGTYIGVELVGKNGEFLTNVDPAYNGIHYNRSVMIMPNFGEVATGRVRIEVPEIHLSLENLLSDIKHILKEPRNLKTLSKAGVRIRFREGISFPEDPADSVSEWIMLDENTRESLINYLVTD